MNNFTPLSALAGGVLIGLASVWLLAAGFLWSFFSARFFAA